jgi:hypothetical protein
MAIVERRYHDSTYLSQNPDWDRQDSPWKADLVRRLLNDSGIMPSSVCEVGCGAGDVLVNLKAHYPDVTFYGYDISPQAAQFWKEHERHGIHFQQGDFFDLYRETYDVLMLLDVIEHLSDPFTFLERLRGAAEYFVLHIPLDLSALSVLRERPLMEVRAKVGHIHYYTKSLALATVQESGFEVLSWRYSGAALNSPGRTLKTRLAMLPRRLLYALHKDIGVRALGGETLLVLARAAR